MGIWSRLKSFFRPKPKVPSIGKPLVTPKEAARMTPSQRGRVEVVSSVVSGGRGGVSAGVLRSVPKADIIKEIELKGLQKTVGISKDASVAIKKSLGGRILTGSQLTDLASARARKLRMDAGTFGKGLGEAQEMSVINKYLTKQPEQFISQRQIGYDKKLNVPIMQTIITDKQGKFVRKATGQEQKEFRRLGKVYEPKPIVKKVPTTIITNRAQASNLSSNIKKINLIDYIPNVVARNKINSALNWVDKNMNKPGRFEQVSEKLLELQEYVGKRLKESGFGKTQIGEILTVGIPVKKKPAVRFVADIGKFVFFGPAMKTTGEQLHKFPTDTKVKFTGKQKVEGNKIITDVVFTSSGKRVGVARGVTVVSKKGKVGYTLTLGKSGIKVYRFPGMGKPTFVKPQVFGSLEKVVTKPTTVKRAVDLIKEGKKVGTINIIKDNVKTFIQFSRGAVITSKGNKIITRGIRFPSGKIHYRAKITYDDIASISSVLTKGDLSRIVGTTFTKAGDRVTFIGVIKGTKSLPKYFKVGGGRQRQFSEALSKVISATSGAMGRASRIKGKSGMFRLGAASLLLSTSFAKREILEKPIPPSPKLFKLETEPTIGSLLDLKVGSTFKFTPSVRAKLTNQLNTNLGKTKLNINQLTKQEGRIKGKIKLLTKQKPIQKQKAKLKQIAKIKIKQQLRLRTLLKIKQVVKAKPRVKIIPRFKVGAKGKLIPIIPPFKFKIRKLKKKKLRPRSYHAYTRPLKRRGVKKRPKLLKITEKPVSKRKAKSLGAYITDRSLSRTFKIKGTGKKPRKSRLKVPAGYFKRTRHKFRSYKIRKGKRIPLKNKWIEKRKRLLDTISERRGITARRRLAILRKRSGIKPIRKTFKRKPVRRLAMLRKKSGILPPKKKRKMTFSQKEVMLNNLKKARRIKKLKGGRNKRPVRR